MCGIAGAMIYNPSIAKLNVLFSIVDASVARGQDAFGVVRWSKTDGFTSVRHFGSDRSGWIQTVGLPDPEVPTFYLHTSRAEPTTEWLRDRRESDIPPFVDKGIVVAHNGIISNDAEIVADYSLPLKSSIDTAIIPPLVSQLSVWETVSVLQGGSALAIFDSYRSILSLCRNFLPLVISWQPGIVCFASEASFFPGAGTPFPCYQLWGLPPYSGIEISAYGYRGPIGWGEIPIWSDKTDWLPYPRWEEKA